MVVSIKGKKHWLWRAVDANGYVFDTLLQSRRNKEAAPRAMVTDKLRSYSAAKPELMPGCRASLAQGIEQSSREFTSSRATTGTTHDALQVGAAMPAFRLYTWPDRQSLPSSPQVTIASFARTPSRSCAKSLARLPPETGGTGHHQSSQP